jgi:hypothetical protein
LCGAIVLILSTAAFADHTFPAFNVAAGFEPTEVALDTSAVPAGPYGGFTVTMTWRNAPADYPAWSIEAVWQLDSPGNPFLIASPGPSPEGEESSHSSAGHVLTWSGTLMQTYTGGDPLNFVAAQSLRGTAANWENVTLTLTSGTVPPAAPPAAHDVGELTAGVTSLAGDMTSNGVLWYKFVAPATQQGECDILRVDTIGSVLTGGRYRNGNDSEIGLYNENGFLLVTGDDIDQLGNNLHSAIAYGADERWPAESSGDLAAGTYYLAVAGFDAEFGLHNFTVTPDSAVEGTVAIHFTVGVPALDCNANGTADVCDLLAMTSDDCNESGVPDECEWGTGDTDGDGDVDVWDFGRIEECLAGPCGPPDCVPPQYGDPCCKLSDMDLDGDVDMVDFAQFQSAFTGFVLP